MSYKRIAMSGAESCGKDQKWDPNFVFNGIKGQCIPASQPLVQVQTGFWNSFMSAFSKPQYAAPTTPSPVPGMQRNSDRNMMIAYGAIALVGLVAIVSLARK